MLEWAAISSISQRLRRSGSQRFDMQDFKAKWSNKESFKENKYYQTVGELVQKKRIKLYFISVRQQDQSLKAWQHTPNPKQRQTASTRKVRGNKKDMHCFRWTRHKEHLIFQRSTSISRSKKFAELQQYLSDTASNKRIHNKFSWRPGFLRGYCTGFHKVLSLLSPAPVPLIGIYLCVNCALHRKCGELLGDWLDRQITPKMASKRKT